MRVKFISGMVENPWALEWLTMHNSNMAEYCDRHGYTYMPDMDWQAASERMGFVGVRSETREIMQPVAGDPPRFLARTIVCRYNSAGGEFSGRMQGCVQLMLEEIADCDLLVWLGVDTIVTNMTIRLEDVMPAQAHVAMPYEEGGYECDGIIVRNSPQGIAWIKDWISWMLDEYDSVWENYGAFVPPFCPNRCTTPDVDPGIHGEWMRSRIFINSMNLTAVCQRYPEHAARIHTFGIKQFMVKHVHWTKGDYIIHVPGSSNEDRTAYMKQGLANLVR